jgi:hypothetical protein
MSQPAWLQNESDATTSHAQEDFVPLKPSSSTATDDDETVVFQLDPNNLSCIKLSQIPRKQSLYWLFKFLTISLCLLMILTALIGLTDVTGIEETGNNIPVYYSFL